MSFSSLKSLSLDEKKQALLRIINVFSPLRVSSDEEEKGLDLSQHGEEAYDLGV